MYCLTVIIHNEKYIEDIILALTENGVKDFQSISSVNEFRRLPHAIPLFAGFKDALGDATPYSRVLFAFVSDNQMPEKIVKSLKNSGLDFINDDCGIIALLPVEKILFKK